MSTTNIFSLNPPKALIFDLMGTYCDWHSKLSEFATDWRAGFFEEIHARFEAGEPVEDIDVTHRRVLDRLLKEKGVGMEMKGGWDDGVRRKLVERWHVQVGWPDALPALQRLREKFFIVVLANGTTRLQLDIARSSGLPFHMLFSSQLLGLTKPDPSIYLKALELMQLRPEECAMVAAHAYDLGAAKKVGLRTIYIQRSTEDLDEDMDAVAAEVDLFIDGTLGSEECGLSELAMILGA